MSVPDLQSQATAHPGRRYGLLAVLGAVAVASFLFALATGSVALDWQQLWRAGGAQQQLILELRLSRAVNAFTCGGLLALAGALLQVLLRNPLADPYILGVSGGASVGALLALLLGLGGVWMTGSAFAGAMLSIFLVFILAHERRGSWTPTRLLLTGVVIAAGWGALISFILVISPDTHLRGMLFWLMGDLSQGGASLTGVVVLAAGLLLALPLARDLNVMVRGDQRASALGVPLPALRLRIYVISALLTATAVTFAGNVGFVGLIIPHFMRLLGARDHRILLPSCVLAGGSLVIVADTLARTLLAPQQLPVGIVTALIGVPVFLYLLHRNTAR